MRCVRPRGGRSALPRDDHLREDVRVGGSGRYPSPGLLIPRRRAQPYDRRRGYGAGPVQANSTVPRQRHDHAGASTRRRGVRTRTAPRCRRPNWAATSSASACGPSRRCRRLSSLGPAAGVPTTAEGGCSVASEYEQLSKDLPSTMGTAAIAGTIAAEEAADEEARRARREGTADPAAPDPAANPGVLGPSSAGQSSNAENEGARERESGAPSPS